MTEPLSAAEREHRCRRLSCAPIAFEHYDRADVEHLMADRDAAREVAHRAEVDAARAETRALRQAVEALADEIDAHDYTPECMDDGYRCRDCTTAEAVRAAAQHAEPDTTPGAETSLADSLRSLVAADSPLLEVARKAIEDELIEWRDSRMFVLRNNGFTIREKDGSDSSIVRFGPEVGVRIALRAMADYLDTPGADQ